MKANAACQFVRQAGALEELRGCGLYKVIRTAMKCEVLKYAHNVYYRCTHTHTQKKKVGTLKLQRPRAADLICHSITTLSSVNSIPPSFGHSMKPGSLNKKQHFSFLGYR